MKLRLYCLIITICAFIKPSTGQLILNCANDSTGLIPLTDLGTGFYGSYTGGLYPGGINVRPYLHEKNGKKISDRIVPINNAGETDWQDGEILFIGMGPSVASNIFNTLIDSMNQIEWEGTNACLKVNGLFLGGKDLYDMVDTSANQYWKNLQNKLDSRGDTWAKVQLIWIFQHSEIDSLDVDYYVNTSVSQYITLLQRMTDSMSNLKQVYLSGFHYTGYTHESHKRYQSIVEPKGYWGNLAIKEVIEMQINGDSVLSYISTPKQAPYISWGPYFWADGKNPRGGDSLSWLCEEFRTDSIGGGFHVGDSGRIKEASMLINFFKTDPVASIWYLANEKWDSCSIYEERLSSNVIEHDALVIYPNPADLEITVNYISDFSGEIQFVIYNTVGTIVLSGNEILNSGSFHIPLNEFPEGLYILNVKKAMVCLSEKFYVS